MDKSKKHHYIPQSLLARFSKYNANKQLYVFDKQRRKTFLSAVGDAGHENDFNTYLMDGVKHNFEEDFQQNDQLLHELICKIEQYKNINVLTQRERSQLLMVIAAQIVRTKKDRKKILNVNQQIGSWITGMGLSIDSVDNFELLSEQDIRLEAKRSFAERDELAVKLADKKLLLFTAEQSQFFLISDNPIVTCNDCPGQDLALDSLGVQIYFPISKHLTLALCDQYSLPDKCEYDGAVVPLNHKETNALNQLQAEGSLRFIFSASNEQFEESKLELSGQYIRSSSSGVKKSLLSGRAPSICSKFYAGQWLIIYANTQKFELQVEQLLLNIENYVREFETKDTDKLNAILNDKPIKEVCIFYDGEHQGTARQVKLECSSEGLITKVAMKTDW